MISNLLSSQFPRTRNAKCNMNLPKDTCIEAKAAMVQSYSDAGITCEDHLLNEMSVFINEGGRLL